MVHTLMFLEPGHFHAPLVLREAQPAVAEDVFVYAAGGPELQDFLALVEAFNGRHDQPTRWRVAVRASTDPLGSLLAERPGDAVVLAGKNDRKIELMRRLHGAGLPVLADKPWLAGPDHLAHVRHVLSGPPLAMEMMTGRHELTGALLARLVADPEVFGGFRAGEPGAAGIWLGSRHHLAKRVNGAPLRRPPWFFDVRVQGDGIADIPTHMVDRAQALVAAAGAGDPTDIAVLSARRWPTRVPRALFGRITGEADFPAALAGSVEDGALAYLGNGAIAARVGGVLVELETRWDLEEPAGGGDTSEAVLRGARADVRVEQSATTGYRRRIIVAPHADAAAVEAALGRALAAWRDLPGITSTATPAGLELGVPDALGSGHESHFPLVLRDFLAAIDRGDAGRDLAARTLAKYTLLTEAGALARRPG